MKRFTRMLSAVLAVATVCAATLVPASASHVTGFYGSTTSTTNGAKNEVTELPITANYSVTKTSAISLAGLLPQARFIYHLKPVTVAEGTVASTGAQGSDDMTVYSGSALLNGELTTDWTVDSQYVGKTGHPSTTLSTSEEEDGVAIDLTKLFTEKYVTTTEGEGEAATVSSTLTPLGASEIKDIESGVYRFELTQEVYENLTEGYKVNIAGKYDETTYRVDLYVQGSTDTDRAYVYLVKVYEEVAAKTNDDGEVTQAAYWGKADPVFNNTIEVEDLIIKNYTENNVTTEDPAFDIAIQILPGSDVTDGVTLKAGTELYAYINRVGVEDPIVVPIHVNTGTGTDVYNNVQLYTGDELVIPGVPVHMHYTTWNADAGTPTNADYTKRVQSVIGYTNTTDKIDKSEPEQAERPSFPMAATLADGTETGYVEVAKDIEYGQNMIIYYNVNKAVNATGVAMESAPYVVMFLTAAAVAVLTVVKKKTDR
jgi:hypothetical protein